MKGILLVSHSSMCTGVKESCEMIVGEQENMKAVSLREEGVDIFREELTSRLDSMREKYEEVIVVTNIPNATPYNECLRYSLSHGRCLKLVSGMNLAMVLELAMDRLTEAEVNQLLDQIVEAGRSSILRA